jgi:hypothetical protein
MPAKVTQLIETLVLGWEATNHQFIVECNELEVHNDWRGVSRTLKEIISAPITTKQHISYFELQDQQEVQRLNHHLWTMTMKFMQTKKDMIEPKMFVKWVKEWELTNHSFVKQLK